VLAIVAGSNLGRPRKATVGWIGKRARILEAGRDVANDAIGRVEAALLFNHRIPDASAIAWGRGPQPPYRPDPVGGVACPAKGDGAI
jgi:hypothetical protein